MKRLLILLVLILGSSLMTGCTPTETSSARLRRIRQITNIQMKMLVEDWDNFWLYERSAGTTQWHPWIGI